jgi:PiT family inorganic phosphate transporter
MWEIGIITVLLAFAFTFTNGFQDASSIAATFIASRSATPKGGILLVAALSFLGAMLGGSAVAFTITGLVSVGNSTTTVVVLMVALLTASIWNIITWKFALPSSSTHSLVGGLIGGGIAAAGTGSVNWGLEKFLSPSHELTGLTLIIVFFILSVLIGFFGSFCLHRITNVVLRNARRGVNKTLIRLNWIAAGSMAFFNGANDTQKQMGIIALALAAAASQSAAAVPEVPFWARGACAVLLAAGTLSGGWRIMKTLGSRIFKVSPIHSFDSQFFSAASLGIATLAGSPVSSNQIIAMSVLGVGAAENPKKVKWSVGKHILIAMGITVLITMVLAICLYRIIAPITGV